MRALRSLFLIISSMAMASCSYVPPLSEATGSIPIRDVVERVKCEIADAFSAKLHQPKVRWLQLWSAKVDLTLIADNTGSITPVGTYVEPLATVGGVAQQFTFGASANISSEAIRTEAVSFSLSLIELRNWRQEMLAKSRKLNLPDPCDPGLRTNIAGNLGLAEWADSALSPVKSDDLQAGDHPAPGSAKSIAKPARSTEPTISLASTPYQIAKQALSRAEASVGAAKDSSAEAAASARKAANSVSTSLFHDVEDREFRRTSAKMVAAARDQANRAKKDADDAERTYNQMQVDAAKIVEGDRREAARTAANAVNKSADTVSELADDAAVQADAAEKNATNVAVRIPDPPIDSISHSVQFIVNAGASIAPSWTLVRFRGPTGNLAGVTAKQTHTLNIALGPRGDNGARFSQEAVRALNNLTLQQIRVTQ